MPRTKTKTKTKTRARPGKPKTQKAAAWNLRLYVAGQTPKSIRAFANLKVLCEEHLKNRYDLKVIDIYQQPNLARDQQIVAVPTLIKLIPLPLRRLVGDMSDLRKVLFGLDLGMQEL